MLYAVAAVAALAAVLLALGLGSTGDGGTGPAGRTPGLAAPGLTTSSPPWPRPASALLTSPDRTAPAARVPAAPALADPTAPSSSSLPGPYAVTAVPAPAPGTDPPPAFRSADTHPRTDDARVGVRTLLVQPHRDGGERSAPSDQLLLTPACTPCGPHRPALPAPRAGHAQAGTAHTPSDLGRAPPPASGT
ncbi:hypothetical protein ACIF8T_37775 [Streptomyces sp. NPDC085946]|uniref:hypothetical protein n=1 Tax=Streptomyces sp. NPDC085946 TaxID=3365744 RepID=UPI0037CFA53B